MDDTENKEFEEQNEQESPKNSEGEVSEISQEEILSEKVKSLETAIEQLKERDIRRQADTDNFKKRLLREKDEAVQFANTKLIMDMLEFLDNLERTIAVAKQGGDASSICQGIQLIQDQLLGTLSKNWGLEKIDCVGKEFDPQEHEACMMETNAEVETETVMEQLQSGYKLHDRVIKPAKVKVAKP